MLGPHPFHAAGEKYIAAVDGGADCQPILLPVPREPFDAARDHLAELFDLCDGIFLTGVRTTGIFCRPSCRARKPLAANVEYFATVREAIFAGYRPCRRCDPAAPPGTVPGWVKTLLDTVEADPSRRLRDEDLRALGVDPARLSGQSGRA